MLTSWHFGADGDILGKKKKTYFSDQKMQKKKKKTGIIFQNSRDPSKGRNFTWLTSERVLNKTCGAIINEKLYH